MGIQSEQCPGNGHQKQTSGDGSYSGHPMSGSLEAALAFRESYGWLGSLEDAHARILLGR